MGVCPKVRWTRHAVQGVLVAVVGWQAVGHVTSGGESAEAWCPLGGFETPWTLLTTGRTVSHVHTSSLVLSVTVLVLAVVGRGFFCGWLCPFGTLQELSNQLARRLGIKQIEIPFGLHERLWMIKYVAFVGILAISLRSIMTPSSM